MDLNLDAPHVMIDLETMSTSARAAILSVGAVYFTPSGATPSRLFNANVDLSDALRIGQEVDGECVYWWLMQSEEARNALKTPSPESLARVLHDFGQFFANLPIAPSGVWSNGASFDLPILKEAHRLCSLKLPWTHRQEFCYRTLKRITAGMVELPQQVAFGKHTALADACYQADCCSKMLLAQARHGR